MQTIPASSYTEYIKLKAANAAYQNGKVPVPNNTSPGAQPAARVPVLNAKLLASEIGARVTPAISTLQLNQGHTARVRPTPIPAGNNPNKLSTITWTSPF